MNILKKIFDIEYKEMKRFEKLAKEIINLEPEISKLSDEELKNKTIEFKEMLANGIDIEELVVPAFAVVREAGYRVVKEKAYYVQILGGLALHYGNIAELKTGEGKTLMATMPAYLNSLTGKGVHIVTVNEFLAERDQGHYVGDIFRFLGLTVGLNLRELTPAQKQEVYNCDIVYSTNNEIGFDYLRDNMVVRAENRVMREPNYVIIDEVDSILIDEARTPLIISGGKMNSAHLYKDADRAVKKLKKDEDYTIDEKHKSVSLTAEGSKKIDKIFNLTNLYDINNTALVHHINQALKANYGMKKDVDYVIENDAIIIVDQFTGRLMHGRQFSEGLHQAIEAKEAVTINEETKTMATITFQNLFRMYNKISGMTGTAKTEEEEFRNIYNMYVMQIPTNKPIIRIDNADLVYATEKGKYKAIVNTIKHIHQKKQPILVGTISVESNEYLSSLLTKEKIPHEVLNAKNHAREAEIVAKAGEQGSVTIATNMAGRGTDIKLGEGVKELGGLYVIGTERHESRRIDNQLRGRSGRQGDPGETQFFVSFEDDLMRRFGTERIKNMIQSVGIGEDQAIRSNMFTKSIESAQKKVEGNNFDVRKSLLDYDNVMNDHREKIYQRRNEIIDSKDIEALILDSFHTAISILVENHIETVERFTEEELIKISDFANNNFLIKEKINKNDLLNKKVDEIIEYIYEKVLAEYYEKLKEIPEDVVAEFEKAISLNVIDNAWVEHISAMEHLREGIGLRGYAQTNPLQAYTMEGYQIFERMLDTIDTNISMFLLKAKITQNVERKQTIQGQASDGKEKLKSKPKKSTKVGRNESCTCGSGKKYKHCCGK